MENIFTNVKEIFDVRCPNCGAFQFHLFGNGKSAKKCLGKLNNQPCNKFIIAERKNNMVKVYTECILKYFSDKECKDTNCSCKGGLNANRKHI